MKNLPIIILLFFMSTITLLAIPKEYYITCEPDDFAKIYVHYSEDIYIPITITYDGKTWDDAEMRIRGDGSRSLPKKSLKVKFLGERFVNGRKKINFNAEYDNVSYLNNILASRLFHETGQVCFNAEHAKLFLNGEFLGLYVMIENVDDDFLIANDLDTEGNLYKATVDGASMSMYDNIDSLFEKKTNKKSGMDDLQKLIDDINNVSPQSFYNFVKNTFEYEKLVNVIAVNLIISNFSTYYHNYYLFHDINGTGKWEMIPWDLDKSYYTYGYYFPYSYTSSFYAPDNPLIERMQIDVQSFADIKERIKTIKDNWFNSDFLNPIIDSLSSDIAPTVPLDNTDDIDSIEQWQGFIDKTKYYVSIRYVQLFEQFDTYPHNFSVIRTPEVISGDVTIKWNRAVSPNDTEVKYNVYYNTSSNIIGDGVQKIMGLSDTTVTLPNDFEDGKRYRWFVEAYNEYGIHKGTDNYNFFTYNSDAGIPCVIKENLTLTKENSPYYINCQVVVEKNAILTIAKGVKIIFDNNTGIKINGILEIKGSQDENVIFEPSNFANTHFNIELMNTPDINTITYLSTYHSIFHIVNSKTSFDNVIFDNKTGGDSYFFAFIKNENGILKVINSKFIADNSGGEGIVSYEAETEINNCSFVGIPDAIEYIRINKGSIENNIIKNSSDDGIDINGCTNIKILNNHIENIADKGISMGLRGDTISKNNLIRGNVIVSTETAVSIKNSSSAHIINNTFVSNNTAVFYDENSGYTNDETTIIENNIFYNSKNNLESNDESTRKTIQYCLYNQGELMGKNNINADPIFVDIDESDYHLKASSPCINAGNPDSQRDIDESIADIGAFYREKDKEEPTYIIVNEIMYKANPDVNCGDWIELYNSTEYSIGLEGWKIRDEKDEHSFIIPANTYINAYGYLIIAKDIKNYTSIYNEEKNIIGGFDFGFGTSDEVLLYDNLGHLIDSVSYDGNLDSQSDADATGNTLELIVYKSDNAQTFNWGVSKNMGGSPSNCNSLSDCSSIPYKSNFASVLLYPNPLQDDNLQIDIDIQKTGNYSLEIFDINGKLINTLIENKYFEINIYKQSYNLQNYRQGVYFIKLIFLDEKKEYFEKMMIIGN